MKNLINTTAVKRLLTNGISRLKPLKRKNDVFIYEDDVLILVSIYNLNIKENYRITKEKL